MIFSVCRTGATSFATGVINTFYIKNGSNAEN